MNDLSAVVLHAKTQRKQRDFQYSNSQYGLLFATENTEKNTKKYQNGFFFVFEFFRVFLCIPWLKNISFDTWSQYF